jgi:guanylate kinase
MNYLFIMGASGSGKTSLAKKLMYYKPEKYNWLTQTTTRPPRDNEKEGREYYFLSEEQYDNYDNIGALIAQVKDEFAPHRYGTPIIKLDEHKSNIIIASIEGFLDAITKVEENDKVNVLFIKDVEPEIKRAERNYHDEEKYNKIVLKKVRQFFHGNYRIIEISHDDLKKIRNNKDLLLKFMEKEEL